MLAEDEVKDMADIDKEAYLTKMEVSNRYFLNRKRDGTRMFLVKDAKAAIHMPNRRHLDYAFEHNLPEIEEAVKAFPNDTIVDTEHVGFCVVTYGGKPCVNDDGVVCISPRFGKICRLASQRRCSLSDVGRVKLAKEKNPTCCDAFDILRLNGKDLETQPLSERVGILEDFVKNLGLGALRFLPYYEKDFAGFFREEDEGVMLKLRNVRYLHSRVAYWLKVKHTVDTVCYVVGYTDDGTGWRKDFWRSLVLVDEYGNYLGKAGGGATVQEVEQIKALFDSYPQELAYKIGGRSLVYKRVLTGLKVEVTSCERTAFGTLWQPRIKSFIFPFQFPLLGILPSTKSTESLQPKYY